MVPLEQEVYARWADWGTRLGLGVLAASFLAYALALVKPKCCSTSWHDCGRYPWTAIWPVGGIAMLALVTVLCYARIAPLLWVRGEWLQGLLAIAQVIVLLIAASGVFAGTE